MNLSFRPGFVYIFHSKNRPADVKIGKAMGVEARHFAVSLGDPDLKLHACAFFLDAFAAESHLHLLFKEQRVGREHFKVSRSKAKQALDARQEHEREQREQFENHCRYMADVGELKLDRSEQARECDGSALSLLLNHVPSEKDGRTVRTLVALALQRNCPEPAAEKLLLRCGLMTYKCEGVVLMDRFPGTRLAQVFKDKTCKHTWEKQLSRYAGLNHRGAVVLLNEWLDTTSAGSELVDRVSVLV